MRLNAKTNICTYLCIRYYVGLICSKQNNIAFDAYNRSKNLFKLTFLFHFPYINNEKNDNNKPLTKFLLDP